MSKNTPECRRCGADVYKYHLTSCPLSGYVKLHQTNKPPKFPWGWVRLGLLMFSISCQAFNLVLDLREAVTTRAIILDIARNSCVGGIIAGILIVVIALVHHDNNDEGPIEGDGYPP